MGYPRGNTQQAVERKICLQETGSACLEMGLGVIVLKVAVEYIGVHEINQSWSEKRSLGETPLIPAVHGEYGESCIQERGLPTSTTLSRLALGIASQQSNIRVGLTICLFS